MERHECYETFYELYEYICISLEAIVDHESHPHVYSSLSFTWDRETKTKAQQPQGLLAIYIEEECHEWFKDASRLADKIGITVLVPRITGRQEHRNNAPSVNLESHYRVNVAIRFIDHLLEELIQRRQQGWARNFFLGSICRGEA